MGDASAYEPITVHRNRKNTFIGIYCLTVPDGRFYIGSSINIRYRISTHRRYLRKGNHHCIRLQRAWNKFGSFSDRILIVCRREDLLFYEQLLMDKLSPSLNVSPVAGKNIWSQETRDKISKARKGFKHTAETKAKISAAKIGVPQGKPSAETSRKRAETLRGNKRRLGCKLSQEHKKKISEVNKGNKHTLGLIHTAEAKAKIGVSSRNRIQERWDRMSKEERSQFAQKGVATRRARMELANG